MTDTNNKKNESDKKAKKWMQKIEKKYDTKLIFVFGEFTDYMYDMFIRQLRKVEKVRKKDDWITVLIHSTGGDADVAYKIMDVTRRHKCKFWGIVPINAASAGAEIAMNMNRLTLGINAYLTAFDTCMGSISLKNITDFDLKRCKRVKDFNKVKEALYYSDIAKSELNKMFSERYNEDIICNLEKLFIQHNSSHETPISFDQIKETGVTHVNQKQVNDWFHKLTSYFIDGERKDEFIYKFYQSRV